MDRSEWITGGPVGRQTMAKWLWLDWSINQPGSGDLGMVRPKEGVLAWFYDEVLAKAGKTDLDGDELDRYMRQQFIAMCKRTGRDPMEILTRKSK